MTENFTSPQPAPMWMRAWVAIVVTAALLTAASLPDQVRAQMPPDIAERVRALGPVINPPETARLYVALHAREPYENIKASRDIRYGVADRHLLDVFVPTTAAASPRPVLVFVHGGGYVAGNKRAGDSPFYDNIMLWAVRNGMVGVNLTYRLAPQSPWPAGAQDVGSGVRWVLENIAGYGGDPQRVFLMGHSAGATHVASYVAGSVPHGPAGVSLAGAILLSGQYDLTTEEIGPPTRAYFGADSALYSERSPLAGLLRSRVPLLVQYGEVDPPNFQKQALLLNERLCGAGRCPTLLKLPHHSHISEVYAINTDDRSLTNVLAEFINRKP